MCQCRTIPNGIATNAHQALAVNPDSADQHHKKLQNRHPEGHRSFQIKLKFEIYE